MKKQLFIILFVAGQNLLAQNPVPEYTSSQVTREDAQKALDFHNKVRQDVGAPPLVWSAELAQYAQEWADYLANYPESVLFHRPENLKKGKDFGENIFYGCCKSYSSVDASVAWYDEIENYTYSILSESNFHNIGHYTQMVWKSTSEVGMGIARFGNGQVIIVANYNPSGNYIGQYPY